MKIYDINDILIDSGPLRFRPVGNRDLDGFFYAHSSEIRMRYYGEDPVRTPEEAAGRITTLQNDLASGDGIWWAITLEDSDRYLGECGIWNIDEEDMRADLGCLVAPRVEDKPALAAACPRNGVTILERSLAAMINFAFTRTSLYRIQAFADPRNVKVAAACRNVRMQYEGRLRGHSFEHGEFLDDELFAVIKTDMQS